MIQANHVPKTKRKGTLKPEKNTAVMIAMLGS
jgi:hypothetical protein